MNTPDLTSYHLVHRALRQSSTQLAIAVAGLTEQDRDRRAPQLERWYAGFETELHTHHRVEDEHFFPALFQHLPSLRGYVDRIDDEHRYLSELIVDTRTAIAELGATATPFERAAAGAVERTAELEALLDRHLDFEDAEILPLFTRHMDAAEYDEVEGRAMASPKLGELRFTVPWLMANADEAERRHLLDGAPAMMKVLWFATRRGHDRLTTAALGAPVRATEVTR